MGVRNGRLSATRYHSHLGVRPHGQKLHPGHAARAGRESEHLWGRVGAWHQKHDVLHEVPKQHVVHVKMRPSRVIVVVPQSAHARVATARSNAAVKTVRSMAGSPSEGVSVRQSAPDLPRNTRSQDICTPKPASSL